MDLAPILQRVTVREDMDIVCDPDVVGVAVTGLPRASRWFFGLSVGAEGSRSRAQVVALEGGRGRMFVPRGVPLTAKLFARTYSTKGEAIPLGAAKELTGFRAQFTIPDSGEPKTLRIAAPTDLMRQLAAIVKDER